jgi:hypothetical protein
VDASGLIKGIPRLTTTTRGHLDHQLMEFTQRWREEKSEMVSQKTKQRMFSLFEELVNVPEAADIVAIEIYQHFFAAKFDPLVNAILFFPAQINPQQSQVHLVHSLGQHRHYFVELRREDYLIDPSIVDFPFSPALQPHILPPQLKELLSRTLFSTENRIDRFEQGFDVSLISFLACALFNCAFEPFEERLAICQSYHELGNERLVSFGDAAVVYAHLR